MNQQDFVQEKIPAKCWAYFGSNPYRIGKRSITVWVPKSIRAIAWFEIASYENCTDEDLLTGVKLAFGTAALDLIIIYENLGVKHGSRMKDITQLMDTLSGFEKIFQWGQEHNCFRNVMAPNASPHDFWTLIKFINDLTHKRIKVDKTTQKKFIRGLAAAMNDTFDSLMAVRAARQ